ncbi:MAG TPA: helix-turn-helix transcriptional regulator [Candidatus Methylacidiphilales bacterium]|jgi:DNA-binding CsgD family transcriptional regulator|nr:helix-turn-helix transcriptional regulator [Candidatus Methylacidiphilales bacterium]
MADLSEHQVIARPYQADSTRRLGQAMFDLIGPRMKHEGLAIVLLPIKFELPSLCWPRRIKACGDDYIRINNKYDLWLKRSPVGPHVKLVRHSDHTPLHILKRSLFYKKVMAPYNFEHGTSIVAWHGNQWLATLTVFRSARQGDLSDAEMEQLRRWQVHFETSVRRLAQAREERLDEDSLSSFIRGLPTSAFFMKWDLTLGPYTAGAVELCNLWRRGLPTLALKSASSKLVVPREILEAIPRLKPRIEAARLARPGPLRPVEFGTVTHPRLAGLSAKIYFIPSKSLTLSSGRFLVEIYYDRPNAARAPVANPLSRLSRSERAVSLEAARGLSNEEIARALRKSPGTVKVQLAQAFKKLKLKSRAQLASRLNGAAISSLPPGALGRAAVKA